MPDRSEVMEPETVRDASAAYSVETGTASLEDVPPGYKQAEIGVIPKDWETKTLKEVAPLQRGFDLPASKLKEGPYPVVFSNGIWAYHAKPMVRGPGVVTGRSGTLGRVQFITADYWPHNTTLWVTTFKNNESLYIYYLYEKLGFERFQSGSGVPTLNRNDAHSYTVALAPTKGEQRAIATALSDADALIESLDRLIAKKRAIKQAAMQQLLTGQTRLPGFTGKWETKRLGDVAAFHKGNGLSKAELIADGMNSCIHYGELFTRYGETINNTYSRTNRESARFTSLQNDVLMPTSDVTPNGLATASCITRSGVILGGDILVIRCPESEVNGTFLAYKIRCDYQQIMQLVSGTTVFHIYGHDMANFAYKTPKFDEQRAIVSVLSDMDTEIEALEHRRDKACQIKQGMMQQLLTGRVRLVNRGAPA